MPVDYPPVDQEDGDLEKPEINIPHPKKNYVISYGYARIPPSAVQKKGVCRYPHRLLRGCKENSAISVG